MGHMRKTTKLSHSAPLKYSMALFRCFGADVIMCLSIIKEQRLKGRHLTARRITETPTALSDGRC